MLPPAVPAIAAPGAGDALPRGALDGLVLEFQGGRRLQHAAAGGRQVALARPTPGRFRRVYEQSHQGDGVMKLRRAIVLLLGKYGRPE